MAFSSNNFGGESGDRPLLKGSGGWTSQVRLQRDVVVILLAPEGKVLVPGATAQANTVLLKSQEERKLVAALEALLPDK